METDRSASTSSKWWVRAVLGEDPTPDVVQRIFALCDTDGNGSIELAEFLDVMSDWLGGTRRKKKKKKKEEKAPLLTFVSSGDEWEKRRKGTVSVAEERVGAHQSIKAFFSQFNEGSDNFAAARQKLKVRNFSSVCRNVSCLFFLRLFSCLMFCFFPPRIDCSTDRSI
jgi:hypothetical protein